MNNNLDNVFSTLPLINGCWQMSAGHASLKRTENDFIKLCSNYLKHGLTTFDCADIYTGVEGILGQMQTIAKEIGCPLKIHTKYVPDLEELSSLNENKIEKSILRSCRQLNTEALDLVQLHWWNYQSGDYLAVLTALQKLKEKGLIKDLGLTNFNTFHLQKILDSGIHIASLQIQYSFLDRRGEKSLFSLAKKNNIKILAYGSLAGGFFSSKWLGVSEPCPTKLANRSLIKYLLIIKEFGGWKKFQLFLKVLEKISKKHQLNIAEFTCLYLLKYTPIDAVILGISFNFKKNPLAYLEQFVLSNQELQEIKAYLDFILPGDIYDLERDDKEHAQIMKYNLNKLNYS